ncbi:MAG TPA: class I SAM-dependent DNA methyltransferase [Hymenobacter sp.]|uniref:type I restriction-modification system subunit M n=1 Tax=Hymenobacter sp. TaxID=1898978 RepID=UPI002D7F52C0|nr:class I SAM-dependent DNA methyltransferase [Hymenobacter sp.]HET9505366.1 class I SAM-dependent DNA methyltransferase [Hymenobacter sp.]
MPSHQELSNHIWQVADLLRGPYRAPQYERVILPLIVLRRFDCVLDDTRVAVQAEFDRLDQLNKAAEARGAEKLPYPPEALDAILNHKAGRPFHNHSKLDFASLAADPNNLNTNIKHYLRSFSANVQRIFKNFDFEKEIDRMEEAHILYLIVRQFMHLDLHVDKVSTYEMGLLFENLIRRFNEAANETAGDYFTPRDVIHLLVDLLLTPDDKLLQAAGEVRTLLDPTCGTGGMLSEAQHHVRKLNRDAHFLAYGQDFNPRAYAVAASDFLIKNENNPKALLEKENVRLGDTLTDDQFEGQRFNYFLANPPFGLDWKKQQKKVQAEHDRKGFEGRFGAGLPRINDGSFLFLQHMISKFEPYNPAKQQFGSRLAMVFNGSPLFSGGAGSGESNIRKWIIENDWLEAVVALPDQLFYNTGITTYIWVLTNRKEEKRRGKVQLIDARTKSVKMRRSLGSKRYRIADGSEANEPDQAAEIVRLYANFDQFEKPDDRKLVRIFPNEAFGYTRLTVERPLRLRFQLTLERKSRFFDACPYLLDDVQAVEKAVGLDQQYADWNAVKDRIEATLKQRGSKWRKPEMNLFRAVMTDRDPRPEVAPVIAENEALGIPRKLTLAERYAGWLPDPKEIIPGPDEHQLGLFDMVVQKRIRYEADPELRDNENVPLLQAAAQSPHQTLALDVPARYFAREVLPHVPDAWLDREKDKSGYEINFNRHFYTHKPPRPLAEIDADLKAVEEKIMRLLAGDTV